MLYKTLLLLDTKVINSSNGEILGRVKEFILSRQEKSVRMVGVTTKDGEKYISLNDVKAVSRDAVLVDSEQVLKREKDLTDEEARMVHGGVATSNLTKSKVVTSEGKELGVLKDLEFDPLGGKIESVEVSAGLRDVLQGTKKVDANEINTIGRDTTIVNPGQAAEKNDNNVIDRQPPREAGQIPVDTEEIKQSGGEDVIGMYATKNILNDKDEIVVKRGDMITHQVYKRVLDNGLADQLEKYVNPSSPI